MFLNKDINVSAAVKEKVLDIFYRKNCIRKASAVDDVVSYLNGTGSSASARDLFVCNLIVKELIENNISEDEAYAAIASHIFVENMEKMSYVRLFFIIFGKKCEEILRNNIKNKTYTDAPLDKFQAKCKECNKIISSKCDFCDDCKSVGFLKSRHSKRAYDTKENNENEKLKIINIINSKYKASTAINAVLDIKNYSESKVITYDFIAEEINKKFGTSYTGRQLKKINSGRK